MTLSQYTYLRRNASNSSTTEMSIQHPVQLRSSPHSAYYSSFFLLRTAVIFNSQPAEIDCSADGELTLSCRYPSVNVSLHTITVNLGAVLRQVGVSTVTHFYCEQAPLFQVCFSSEEKLEKFLQAKETVETELASLLSAMLSEQLRQTNPEILEDVPTVAVAEVFLIRPHVVQKEAQVIKVTVENCSECMALWKESEMFDFGSLFRVYRMDPSKLPGQGAVTLKTLVTELHDVVSWFSLGILLDIPEPELMKIRADHREKTDACKSAMFSQWLRNGPAEPTWSAVVRALLGIRMRTLACKIALKYGVTLPPSVEARAVHNLPFITESAGSISATFHTTIQQLSEEMEENEQKLMRVAQNISQAQAEKEAASKEQKRYKHTLATAHSRTRRFIEEKRELQSQLEMKRKELLFLQLLPEQQQQKNEDLRAIIAHKNVEVMELQEKLQRVEKELQSAREEAQFLRQKLHQITNQLTEKSTRVQELERARSELRGDLERERKRVDQLLMQSAAATSKENLAKEIRLQLSHMQLESKTTDTELAQHKKTIAQKEEETRRLSEQVRALEAQLQEVQDQHSQAPSTAELELEEQLQRLTVETSELRVQLAEAEGEKQEAVRQLESVVKQKGELLQLIDQAKRMPDPEKCRAVGLGVESAETDKVTHFQVHLAEADGDPCTSVQEVTAELRSLVNGSVTPATVVCKTPDTYEASYQPSIRGRHELSVVVNGTPIQGSPFRVYIRHPPHLLGWPVRTISGLREPSGVATTSKGEIIVTEKGKFSFLSKDGQRLKSDSVVVGVPGQQHNLHSTGVAVDGDGNIYVSDSVTDRLFKFNSEGRVLKSVGGKGEKTGQFNNPDGVAIRNSKLYVCDKDNYRIQVFSTDLSFFSFISSFGTRGSGEGQFQDPTDLAFDSTGNLYVADSYNDRVQVFSPSGTFLRQFGSEGEGPGQLSFPCGIHVDHDVVECGNDRVSIFNTSGGFISSFCKMGLSGEAELLGPHGVTTDQDGFVCVCDTYNNRIQVF